MPYQHERYRGEPYRRQSGDRREERGFVDRAGDEVRSWFGDEEAEQRRRRDAREETYGGGRPYAYGRGYDYRRGYERSRAYDPHERGWDYEGIPDWGERWGMPERSWPDYERGYGHAGYGGGYGEGYRPPSERYGQARERNWPGTFAGRGPKGYQRSDERIREDVCDWLTEAPDIDASEIEVVVHNGEVTLSGCVRERAEKRRAEDLIDRILGVREIQNALRVGWPQEQPTETPPVTSAATARTASGGANR